MRVHLLVSPYDSGRRDWRMGRGPLHVAAAAAERLRGDGHDVTTIVLDATEPLLEVRTAFELCRRIAEATRAARAAGAFPLLLAGNCSATVGLLAGLAGGRRGVVWLDAHADFNTPESSVSGYLDGMALAIAAGRCWTPMTAAIPGHAAVQDEDIVLVGARDLDPGEVAALSQARVSRLSVADVRAGAMPAALGGLASRVKAAVLHVDVDVHDPEGTPANCYPVAGGLFPEEVRAIARQVAQAVPLAGATIAAFDPGFDATGATAEAVIELCGAMAAAAS
jgi:arginase